MSVRKTKREARLAAIEDELRVSRKVQRAQLRALHKLTKAHEQQREVIVRLNNGTMFALNEIEQIVRNWMPQR